MPSHQPYDKHTTDNARTHIGVVIPEAAWGLGSTKMFRVFSTTPDASSMQASILSKTHDEKLCRNIINHRVTVSPEDDSVTTPAPEEALDDVLYVVPGSYVEGVEMNKDKFCQEADLLPRHQAVPQ